MSTILAREINWGGKGSGYGEVAVEGCRRELGIGAYICP